MDVTVTEAASAIAVVLSAAAGAYALWTKHRSNAKQTERDQVMRDYGLILGELREENKGLRTDSRTLWEFQMRRANLELMRIQAQGDSVVVATVSLSLARKYMAPILGELEAFKAKATAAAALAQQNHKQLMLELERELGPQIVEKVCLPTGMFEGSCLLMAAAVLTGQEVIHV